MLPARLLTIPPGMMSASNTRRTLAEGERCDPSKGDERLLRVLLHDTQEYALRSLWEDERLSSRLPGSSTTRCDPTLEVMSDPLPGHLRHQPPPAVAIPPGVMSDCCAPPRPRPTTRRCDPSRGDERPPGRPGQRPPAAVAIPPGVMSDPRVKPQARATEARRIRAGSATDRRLCNRPGRTHESRTARGEDASRARRPGVPPPVPQADRAPLGRLHRPPVFLRLGALVRVGPSSRFSAVQADDGRSKPVAPRSHRRARARPR